MFKRTVLAACLVACTMVGSAAAGFAAGLRGGGLLGMAPASIVPASAQLYIALDTSGGQGEALAHLWDAYRSHPGTAPALDRLMPGLGSRPDWRRVLGGGQMGPAQLIGDLGDAIGLAEWGSVGANTSSQRAAIVARLKPSALMNSGSLLSSLGQPAPATNYRGVTIYHSTGGSIGNGYLALVSGDGVLATDLPTMESIIDSATFHAPNLASDAAFLRTTATLPAPRLLTVYVTPQFLGVARSSLGRGIRRRALGTAAKLLDQPYAIAMSVAPDGLSIVSSAVSASPLSTTTPNQGAGVVGSNAVLYASLGNVAALLTASGVMPANTFAQIERQTGISIQRDVLPLLSHEVVIDVNDETSTLLSSAGATVAGGSQQNAGAPVPALPGSLELAMWVDSPAAAQAALQRMAAALLKALQRGQSSSLSLPALTKTTLPDGSIGYNVTALPSVGFTIRGHWVLLSTNLNADITSASAPLAQDPEYQAALAHVAGVGQLVNVEYLNIGRLLKAVTAWVAFVQSRSGAAQQSQPSPLATWKGIAPVLAPIRNIMAVTRQAGPGMQQLATFITIKP